MNSPDSQELGLADEGGLSQIMGKGEHFTCLFSIKSNSSKLSDERRARFAGFATDMDITGERYEVPSSILFDEMSISLRVTIK